MHMYYILVFSIRTRINLTCICELCICKTCKFQTYHFVKIHLKFRSGCSQSILKHIIYIHEFQMAIFSILSYFIVTCDNKISNQQIRNINVNAPYVLKYATCDIYFR